MYERLIHSLTSSPSGSQQLNEQMREALYEMFPSLSLVPSMIRFTDNPWDASMVFRVGAKVNACIVSAEFSCNQLNAAASLHVSLNGDTMKSHARAPTISLAAAASFLQALAALHEKRSTPL